MGTRAAVWVLAGVSVLGWGVAAGLGAALLALPDEVLGPDEVAGPGDVARPGDVAGPGDVAVPGDAAVPDGGEPVSGPSPDTYALSVHSDGCGIIRSEGPEGVDLDPLVWSVTDSDGFEVLGRNALGETRYRYFVPGQYDVVLESWGGDHYVPVSNMVTITC